MSESRLLATALRLGAAHVAGWSEVERARATRIAAAARKDAMGGLCALSGSGHDASGSEPVSIAALRKQILEGEDPLGAALLGLRSSDTRRRKGATYTPVPIAQAILAWAQQYGAPERVVDPGVGSGRFLLEAARLFPSAELVGVDIDPAATMIARANLAACGAAARSTILLGDYRRLDLRSGRRTLFVGNPPYVRHHLSGRGWKRWLAARSREIGLEVSGLAGLHVYFLVATLRNARNGDVGAFITAAEWLDVNYGRMVRSLFHGKLGGRALIILDPERSAFPDAATTATVMLFTVGSQHDVVRVHGARSVDELRDPRGGRLVSRKRLELESRWSRLTRAPARRLRGLVELGELCRVHRGQATGANHVWIAGEEADCLPPALRVPTVTRARELFVAGEVLTSLSHLRQVIDLPVDLEELDAAARRHVARFLEIG